MKKYSYSPIKVIYTLKHLFGSNNDLAAFLSDDRTWQIRDNSLFICAGLGISNKSSLKAYSEQFLNINNALQSLNSNLLVLRDDYDDITLYRENKATFSNISLLDDVSMIDTNLGNILCIGGRTLINRSWYIKKKPKNIEGYYDRSVTLTEEIIKELSENKANFNVVISNVLPTFIDLADNKMIHTWSANDNKLIKDIDNERNLMDSIYCILRKLDTKQSKIWEYTTYADRYSDEPQNIGGVNFNTIGVYPHVVIKDKKELSEKVKLAITTENTDNLIPFIISAGEDLRGQIAIREDRAENYDLGYRDIEDAINLL